MTNFPETRIWCHLGDGRAVYQVGTHGANCWNRNRIGDPIANSQRLVRHHGLPRVTVLNWYQKFIIAIWMHYSRKVGMKLNFSTTFHSQMVGKTKRVNEVLNRYLRNLVGADKRDWADYVGRAEFSCNVAIYLATKGSSFVVAYVMRFNLLTELLRGHIQN